MHIFFFCITALKIDQANFECKFSYFYNAQYSLLLLLIIYIYYILWHVYGDIYNIKFKQQNLNNLIS